MKAFRRLCAWSVFLCMVFCGCTQKLPEPSADTNPKEIRAVWISCYDLPDPQEIRTEESFRAMAETMIANIRNAGLNTVFLHVRPFSDALYRSAVFPYSAVISGKEGTDPGYDALEIFCDCAKKAAVSLHAWINPFRIGSASGLDEKADGNPAKQILRDNDPQNDSRVVNVDGTLYYDPANRENQDLVVRGVRELLENYPVDGIHIDDYFYPATEPYIDQTEYDAYLNEGGSMALGDWRRAQIHSLIGRIYTCVQAYDDRIFSISPSHDMEKNREELFADVARWIALDGYCDWIIPQLYVGFMHETHPFCETAAQWCALERSENVRILFGLAAYKCGTEDIYAGSGRNEWIERNDILSRQITYIRSLEDSSGFSLFAYTNMFAGKMSDNSISEMNSVISVL